MWEILVQKLRVLPQTNFSIFALLRFQFGFKITYSNNFDQRFDLWNINTIKKSHLNSNFSSRMWLRSSLLFPKKRKISSKRVKTFANDHKWFCFLKIRFMNRDITSKIVFVDICCLSWYRRICFSHSHAFFLHKSWSYNKFQSSRTASNRILFCNIQISDSSIDTSAFFQKYHKILPWLYLNFTISHCQVIFKICVQICST